MMLILPVSYCYRSCFEACPPLLTRHLPGRGVNSPTFFAALYLRFGAAAAPSKYIAALCIAPPPPRQHHQQPVYVRVIQWQTNYASAGLRHRAVQPRLQPLSACVFRRLTAQFSIPVFAHYHFVRSIRASKECSKLVWNASIWLHRQRQNCKRANIAFCTSAQSSSPL